MNKMLDVVMRDNCLTCGCQTVKSSDCSVGLLSFEQLNVQYVHTLV